MANETQQIVNPRKIEVPLVRVATSVGAGLTVLAAEFVDEKRNVSESNITAAQNLLPVAGTVGGIVLALMKNKTARGIGNDLAASYGALATLKLGNVARATISARKMKKLREVALKRGQGFVQSQSGVAAKMTQMSLA